MNEKDNGIFMFRLGLCIERIMEENSESGVEEPVVSLRGLAASSSTEYAIIQKISAGKKDPQFSTLLSIAEGLGISLTRFAQTYESLTVTEILEYRERVNARKRK